LVCNLLNLSHAQSALAVLEWETPPVGDGSGWPTPANVCGCAFPDGMLWDGMEWQVTGPPDRVSRQWHLQHLLMTTQRHRMQHFVEHFVGRILCAARPFREVIRSLEVIILIYRKSSFGERKLLVYFAQWRGRGLRELRN